MSPLFKKYDVNGRLQIVENSFMNVVVGDCLIKGEKGLRDNRIRCILVDGLMIVYIKHLISSEASDKLVIRDGNLIEIEQMF